MIRISNKIDCCGCQACVSVCPKSAISMEMDSKGFLYPKVDEKKCVDCGLCDKVCPFLNKELPQTEDSTIVYAAVHKQDIILTESSSGGAFYEIANYVIKHGGIVYGVGNDNINICHTSIDCIDDILPLMRSKYVQSDTRDTFSRVKQDLKSGRIVLYTGTPCQIAGLKLYLRKEYENLITMDILCHGVPSPGLWRKYMLSKYPYLKDCHIDRISFRNKNGGRINFQIEIEFKDGFNKKNIILEENEKNGFFQVFLFHIYRPSCYHCHFRSLNSFSDITVGDCWNANRDHLNFDEKRGVSTIMLHTDKALHIFEGIRNNFSLEEEDNSIMKKRYESYYSETKRAETSIIRKLLDNTFCFKYLDFFVGCYTSLIKLKKHIYG